MDHQGGETMRASGVKTAIVSALEAIDPDSNVGGESFRHVDLGGREPGALTERAFTVDLTQVGRSAYITLDCQVVSYELTVWFHAYQGVEDRIADDAERMIAALNKLHEQSDDLYAADFDAVDVGPSAIMEGMLEASLDIAVTYRRTGV
jgi:hypothetical protein